MNTGPIERKVTASTGATAVAGLILWLLSTYVFKGEVPIEVVAFIMWLVLTVSAFVGGYLAKHTPRPDLDRT